MATIRELPLITSLSRTTSVKVSVSCSLSLFLSVGNKNDDPAKKQVDTQDAVRFGESMGVRVFETSAKENINVEEVRFINCLLLISGGTWQKIDNWTDNFWHVSVLKLNQCNSSHQHTLWLLQLHIFKAPFIVVSLRCSWPSPTWSSAPRSRARTERRGSESGRKTRSTSTPRETETAGREGRSAAETRADAKVTYRSHARTKNIDRRSGKGVP